MALDPNDPLIPMPWQMEGIRAYRASKAAKAEEDSLRMQQLRLSVEKANEEAGKLNVLIWDMESKITKLSEE